MAEALKKLNILYGGDVTEVYSDVFNSGYYPYVFTILAFAVFGLFVMYQQHLSRGEGQRR